MAHIKPGWGFHVGEDFSRTADDKPTPIDLAPNEYAKPGHVIGYIVGDPASPLRFLRGERDGRVRVHITKQAIEGGGE